MLGAALILPMILEMRAVARASAAHGARFSVWFWADSRQQLSGLSLALMALLLALAVNVGVGTMVESFQPHVSGLARRTAGRRCLCQCRQRQRRRPRSRHGCANGGGSRPCCPAAAPTRSSPACRSRCWASPDHADLSRQLAAARISRRMPGSGLRPGDAVPGQRATGAARETFDRRHGSRCRRRAAPGRSRSIGIYADYGNPKGQIAVNFAALTRRFPETPLTRLGLRVEPSAMPALISALQEKFGLDDRSCRRSGDDEGGIETDFQPHLCGDRGAERLHARRRRHRAADQPADAWPIPACRNWRRYGRSASPGSRLAAIELLKTMSVALITALFALPLGLAGGVVPARDRRTSRRSAGACRSTSFRCNCSHCSALRLSPRFWRGAVAGR
mgnify:CR=1 FL=1